MKKLFLITLTVLATSISFSQLELIKEETAPYNNYKQIAYLSNSKTIFFDVKDNYLNLYKENLDLYKTVKLPSRKDSLKYPILGCNIPSINKSKGYYIPTSYGVDNFTFTLSDKFFNSDEKIEFIVSVTEWENQSRLGLTSTYIMNEDGQIIHLFPTQKQSDINSYDLTFGFINKTFAIRYTKKNNTGLGSNDIKTEFYKVNGLIPCECICSTNTTTANLQKLTESKPLNLSTFPNPNTGKAIITYELPENTTKGTIHLYSQQGSLLKSYAVTNQQTELEIATDEYNSGTYYYELETNGYSSGGKKMIVIN
jgi:hypothetical protein